MIKRNKLTLEQRITRLESYFNNRSRKYESRTDDFYNAVGDLYMQGITNSEDMIEPLANLGFMVPKEFSYGSLRNAVGTAFLKNRKANKVDNRVNSRPQDLTSSVEEWFDNNMGPEMYDSKREWMSDLRWMAKGAPNGSEADDCCDAVGCDDIDAVTEILAKLAKQALKTLPKGI